MITECGAIGRIKTTDETEALSIINPTTDLRLNMGCHSEKPATNCLKLDTLIRHDGE
jgi:hypothetical protein